MYSCDSLLNCTSASKDLMFRLFEMSRITTCWNRGNVRFVRLQFLTIKWVTVFASLYGISFTSLSVLLDRFNIRDVRITRKT